jgi:hypothetical protein
MLLSIESELLQLRAVGMSIAIGATELKKGVGLLPPAESQVAAVGDHPTIGKLPKRQW